MLFLRRFGPLDQLYSIDSVTHLRLGSRNDGKPLDAGKF